MEEWFLVKF